MNWCRIFFPLSFHGWKLWEILLTIGSLVMLKNQESLIKSRCIMVFRTRDNREWTISTVKKGNIFFSSKPRAELSEIIRISFFFDGCLTLNIFILSTVFVHSILYHVILKCSFLSRLTKLCVVRNVLLCIKMLRIIKTFYFGSSLYDHLHWSSYPPIQQFIYLFS